MVVAKSILAGGLTVTPKKNLHRYSEHRVKPGQSQQHSSTSTSLEEDASEVTSLVDENDGISFRTCGWDSTVLGDSFVLAIDWNQENEVNNVDASFDDPYLESTDDIMERIRRHRQPSDLAPSLSRKCQPRENSKSLGAFEWHQLENPLTTPIVAVNQQPVCVGPCDISRIEPQDDSTVESCSFSPIVVEPPDVLQQKARLPNVDLAILLRQQVQSAKPNSLHVARIYRRLGQTEHLLKRYTNAIHSLLQAASIFRRFSKQVALANVLDNVGVVYCEAQRRGAAEPLKNLYATPFFSKCVVEALEIRRKELGPWHVDTVDTLQHLGNLCLTVGHPEKATSHFLEVVNLRKAIFGPYHPSIAVTAHFLGISYMQSHDTMAADVWFEYSLNIYDELGIPEDNPAVAKLLRDRHRAERVERWLHIGLGEDENLLFDI